MTDYNWFGNLNMTDYVNGLLTSATSQLTSLTQKKLAPIQSVQVSLNAQLSSYNKVDKLLSTLSSNITALKKVFNPTPQINTSNPNIVTASQITGQSVSTGTHSLNVSTLATAATYASATQTSSTGSLGSTDTLTIQMASGANFQVNVSASDSLQSIADAINAQATSNNITGVKASVITPSSGHYQLVVNATQTGTANAVTVTDNSAGSPTPLNIAKTQSANDASFTYDGIAMTQSYNSNIAIGDGLNINLLGTGLASLTVTSSSPISSVIDATNTVVDSYNSLMQELSVDQVSLASDATLANIQSSLQGLFQDNTLYGLGITLKDNTTVDKVSVTLADGTTTSITPAGMLEVDEDALTSALSGTSSDTSLNYTKVQSLLTDTTAGVFSNLNSMIIAGGSAYKSLHDSQFGAEPKVQSQIDDVQQQIKDINADYTQQQQDLKMKYGSILAMMVRMQTQSQALSSQIASLGK